MDFEEIQDMGQEDPDLGTTLEALNNVPEDGTSAVLFYGLSGLTDTEVEHLKPVWQTLEPLHRRRVVREMLPVSESNFELDYTTIGWMGLGDEDPAVREAAIALLWEDETLRFMDRLIAMIRVDEDSNVRAAAARGLGHFILLGELDDEYETEVIRAQDAVVELLNNTVEDVNVRRRALEAIANGTHEIVEGAIEEAYNSFDQRMRLGAIFAMGRTYDADRWGDIVLKELGSDEPEIVYEAARAAGELELQPAIRPLSRLTLTDDRELQEMAVWSLGEIGGDEVVRVLSALAEHANEHDDVELQDAVEDALGNATLLGDLALFGDLPFDADEF